MQHTIPELIERAEQLRREQKFEEIIEMLNDRVLEETQSFDLMFLRVITHHRISDITSECRRWYDTAIQLIPDHEKTYFLISRDHFSRQEKGEYNIDLLKRIARETPSYYSFFALGIGLAIFNKHSEALVYLEKAEKLNTNDDLLIGTKAFVYLSQNRIQLAMEYYDKAISLNQKNWWYRRNRGYSYYLANKSELALVDYHLGLQLHYNDDLLTCIGNAYAFRKEYSLAVGALIEATELNPNNNLAYQSLSFVYSKQSKFSEALKAIEQSIAIDPNSNNWVEKGLTLLELGRIDEAKSALLQALEFKETSYYTYLCSYHFYLHISDSRQQIIYYNRALQLDRVQVSLSSLAFYPTILNAYPLLLGGVLEQRPELYKSLSSEAKMTLQDVKRIKRLFTLLHHDMAQWKSPGQYLKWLGILAFYAGDAVVALEILNYLDGEPEFEFDFQLKYYCLQAAYMVFPPVPDIQHLEQYASIYKTQALNYLSSKTQDEEQLHYVMLILAKVGEAAVITEYIPLLYLQSTQYAAAWAAEKMDEPEAHTLISPRALELKTKDFVIPVDPIPFPSERIDPNTGEDQWLSVLSKLTRYYEIEHGFSSLMGVRQDVLRIWNALDLSPTDDLYRKVILKNQLEKLVGRIAEREGSVTPDKNRLFEDASKLDHVDRLLELERGDVLDRMSNYIFQNHRMFSKKECFKVIEYLYLKDKINAEDFIILSIYAALQYGVPTDRFTEVAEWTARPLTDFSIDHVLAELENYSGSINKFIFDKIRRLIHHVFDLRIADFLQLKEVILERIAAEQFHLSEFESIFDDFPLEQLYDVPKLAGEVGFVQS